MGLLPDGSIAVRQAPEKQHIEGLDKYNTLHNNDKKIIVESVTISARTP